MMRHRRSSRTGFLENKDVSDDKINLLLEAARAAPSGGNAQPWEFIIIRDKNMRMQIAAEESIQAKNYDRGGERNKETDLP